MGKGEGEKEREGLHLCGGQGTTFERGFFLPFQVLEIELSLGRENP